MNIELCKALSDLLQQAIYSVWNDVGFDITDSFMNEENCYMDSLTNYDCIEICLDANRLSQTGFKDEEELLMEAVQEHGWVNVINFLSQHITLN